MITKLLTAETLDEAVFWLQKGEPVGIPTETVYGLGCNAFDAAAVCKVFAAKGRPMDNPLIVHIADKAEWQPLVREIPPLAHALADRFWPGPLTIILPKSDLIPAETAGGLQTVGVRFPAHPLAQEIIRKVGVPIAAPSANRSGSPSPTTAAHVMADMNGRIPAVVDGGRCFCGIESTVIAFDDADTVRVLRPGFVTAEQLAEIAPKVIVDDAVLAKLEEGKAAPSPGMKYRHYSPNAQVIMLNGDAETVAKYISLRFSHGDCALVYDSDRALYHSDAVYGYGDTDESRGAQLFARLREMDELGFSRIFVRAPRTDGVGLAVYNRLLRAAGYDVRDTAAKIYLVGLTGQTGAGKTTVSEVFATHGFAVINADTIARDVVQAGSACLAEITQAFGESLLLADGTLDRKQSAKLIFSDADAKKRYESIIFPHITKAVFNAIDAHAAEGRHRILLDAPTLFESGLHTACDYIVSVVADEQDRLQRIMQRDGISAEVAVARIASQHTEEFFCSHTDAVLKNHGTVLDLVSQAKLLIARLPDMN